jgi:hypothetical protein
MAPVISRRAANSGRGEFDIPDVTEIEFAGGLTPGHFLYFLYGLVTSRIQVVRAESHKPDRWSEVMDAALPGVTASDGTPLRTFVLVRPPIDDVSALVGLDQSGQVVQRLPLYGRGDHRSGTSA